ncbi:TPA: type II toxin-antitoxin system HigB family toxin [Aeromonas hydrophila]|uniref:type II toxin-antitoxin system HigB family toxin n=1 Tax=Aeromonas hydrophila TaxID=644 RepID=UPI0024416299|nr:type II toxin-antitoxin system HigB family toxin [Aeromonas hydrophila]
MRTISHKALSEFWTEHADAEGPLRAWLQEMLHSCFATPQDIKNRYSTASFIGDNRVIFNIGGNKYRLVVYIRYELQLCYVKFIGTHAEYDRVNVLNIEK